MEVTPPPDGAPVIMWAHEDCFARFRDSSVVHDDPKDHGRIPVDARCIFCGLALPTVGKHPFVFDLGSFSPPHRFWSHAGCMLERLVPSVIGEIDGPMPPGNTDR